MASGRPDYWYQFLPGKTTLGKGQSIWIKAAQVVIDSGDNNLIINYEVPVDYILIIQGMGISCSEPGINGVNFNLHDVVIGVIYFDVNYNFPNDSSGICQIIAGNSVMLRGWNIDNRKAFYYGYMYGFLSKV